MRPRRLQVKGYTAFVEEAELDFDGLDLFAITGPTGAGKTSLLQAMTIALYGRAPKLGDDLRQLISPLAERAHFHFEFRAHGRCYRITRVMFRARPTTVALEGQHETGQWETLTRGVREANTRVEEILGLDFDSFTKVVLLPQNEFDAFLRGKPEERRSILTKLLSLEIYGRIQQKANQKAAEARTQAELLTKLVDDDYGSATPERLAEVKEERAVADARVAGATTRLEAIEQALAAALELRQHRGAHRAASDSLAAHEHTLASARGEHESAAATLVRLATEVQAVAARLAAIAYDADRHLLVARAAERAVRLGEVAASLARLDSEDAESRDRAEKLERRRTELGRTVTAAERALAATQDAERKASKDLDEQQQRFGTRATIAGLVERERRYRDDRERLAGAERALQALTARQAELNAKRRIADSDRAEASARLETARRAREARERAFEECRTMSTRALALGEQLTAARDRDARAHKAAERATAEAGRKATALREAEVSRQSAQDSAQAAGERLRHLEHAHAAHHLRAALAVGQPCPVCETKVKKVPALELVADLAQARDAADEASRGLAEAQRAEQRAAAAAAASDEALRTASATLADIRKEVAGVAADLRQALPPEARDDERWPEALRERLEAAAASRDAAQRDLDASGRRVAEADAAIAGLDAELKTLPARIDQERAALRSCRAGCEEAEQHLAAVLGAPVAADAAAKLAEIDAGLRAAEEALTAASSSVHRARATLTEAQAAAGDAKQQTEAEADRARTRAGERERLVRETDDINGALGVVVPGRADAVHAIAAELKELVDARTRQDTARRELEERRRDHEGVTRQVAELTARIGALERQLEDLRTREKAARGLTNAAAVELTARLGEAGLTLQAGADEEHAELSRAVTRAREEREAVVRRSVELAGDEQVLAERIARAAEHRDQRDAARARMEVARELGQLLGANNLQNDLLADAMRVLVEDGSAHLQRLSDGRYRLRAEELDFHVVDAWNGDAVRSVKTLSGGETFLTSLALALALAERLADLATGAHGHEALESLFVDEGFGALDSEETLETVVQAIEALQSHDRVVGIVTHLTPLAERMPAQIRVRKAPEGSRLEIVR